MKRPILTVLVLLLVGILLGVAYAYAPAGSLQAAQYDRQIVRAYFDDPNLVDVIASWKEPWDVNYDKGYLVADVTPAEYEQLVALGFQVEVDPVLTAEIYRPRQPLPGQGGGIPGYPCYRTVEETYDTAATIAANYPNLATWTDVGDSWEKTQNASEGYDMMVLRLTNSAIPGPKPKIFIIGAIHAREYTTAEMATRYGEYLVQNYGIDADATWLLDYHEVHLMLHTNPDGRKQAETGDLWRKNTNNNYCTNTSSRGADLNRNFQFMWDCCGGSDDNQCSDTYHGATPASEPEVQAVQNYVFDNFIDQRGPNLTDPAPADATGVFIDLHSYSQLVLWPWGFAATDAPNAIPLQTLGRKFAYFNDYEPMQADELYITDGTTDDFVYGEMGVAAYTFEMGTSFFQSCSAFENTIFPDNLPALVYAAKVARTPYMTPAGPDALELDLSAAAVEPGVAVTLTAQINDTRFSNNNGNEPVQNIAAAEYYIDVPPWITETTPIAIPMVAVDGNFNGTVEAAQGVLDTTGLSTGRHILYVRGRDANNNWGAISAIFLYVIDPEVAPVVQGYVREAGTNLPLAATVSAGDFFQTTTDPATGFYQMNVISGTYDLTATAEGHAAETVNDVTAEDFETVEQDFSLNVVCTAFGDDIENGTNGWTTQGSPAWAITTEASHSATHSWTDSPGGNYGNGRNTSLVSPLLDLTDYTGTTLRYWQICDTEAGYDYCHVEVSTNGGGNWTEVAVFDGNHTQWEEISIPVPMLDGEPDAQIRFRFTSDGGLTEDGWHIDDIEILGGGSGCSAPIAPEASFTSTSPDALGDPTTFTNTSIGTDPVYEWDFGDGSTSSDTNPEHTYAAAGTYNVTLTATNDLGSDVYTATVEILLGPDASFTSSSPDELGQPTTFTNTSTGDDLTFEWDFGDGSTSSDANPEHTYAAAGTYTVTLTATNATGSSIVTGSVTITDIGAPSYMLYLPVAINE